VVKNKNKFQTNSTRQIVTYTNLHKIYHYIKKESTSDIKVFNSLAHSIKNLGDNPKQLKLVLKNYLYAHSSYSVGE